MGITASVMITVDRQKRADNTLACIAGGRSLGTIQVAMRAGGLVVGRGILGTKFLCGVAVVRRGGHRRPFSLLFVMDNPLH